MPSPEELAREKIDALLQQCGWIIQNRSTINHSVGRGIAIREDLLKGGKAECLMRLFSLSSWNSRGIPIDSQSVATDVLMVALGCPEE